MACESIKLGLMVPQTGLVDMYGQEISWAGQIACTEVNEMGGILGSELELIIVDDGSVPHSAIPAANRLIETHHCKAIIGNLLSNSRIAVANLVAEPQKVPLLNFSFYEGSISSRYFFHFAALPNQQIDKMIPYVANEFGPKIFFAGSNYEWPRGSIDAAKRTLIDCGGEVVGEAYLPIGSSEIDRLLGAVSHSGADVFVPYFAGADQIALLTRFTQLGLKKRMKVVMGHYDEAMVKQMPESVREGFYSVNTYFMGVDTPKNVEYMERLKNMPEVTDIWPHGNGILTNFGEGAYLCVHAFANAVNQCGSFETELIVDALKRIQVEGPQGKVIMDPATHHASVNTRLAICNFDGTFTVIKSFGQLPPKIPERYSDNSFNSSTDPVDQVVQPKGLAAGTDRAQSELSSEADILSVADAAIIAADEQGIVVNANRCSEKMFGYHACELIGMSIHNLLPPRFRRRHQLYFKQFVEGECEEMLMGSRGEISGYRQDGSLFPAAASISKTVNGNKKMMVVTLTDISEQKIKEMELLHRSTHDPLTDLPNRLLLEDRLVNALQRAVRNNQHLALMFIDLDNFKLVNDTYGHQVGDKLLVEISRRLLSSVRPGDTVARFGGDEFIILSEHACHEREMGRFAERIRQSIIQPILVGGINLQISASIGIAINQDKNIKGEELLRNADTALYGAKEKGRDCWHMFDQQLHDLASLRLDISNKLRFAIERNELRAVFQPILTSYSRQMVGVEILLRWRCDGCEISPSVFIPIAELSGAIHQLGMWIFEQACITEHKLRIKHDPKVMPFIAVNVSARQLDTPDLPEKFKQIIASTGADPRNIVLEITETSLMMNINSNIYILHELAQLGMKIAIDDFGTGYSSLSQILNMPIGKLKIDRVFIESMDKSKDSLTIVRTVIRMAHELRLEVVAEGVEREAQFEKLKELGADCVQGFYFSKPIKYELLGVFMKMALKKQNNLISHYSYR